MFLRTSYYTAGMLGEAKPYPPGVDISASGATGGENRCGPIALREWLARAACVRCLLVDDLTMLDLAQQKAPSTCLSGDVFQVSQRPGPSSGAGSLTLRSLLGT